LKEAQVFETTDTTITTFALDDRALLQRSLAWAMAIFAIAGGLIHLEASIDHHDLPVIAIGFGAMAISQVALAGIVLLIPNPRVFISIGALHAGIALIWITSRTVGLPFIPGAEQAAPVGVADLVANTFSIAVVGLTIVALSLDRSNRSIPLKSGTRAIKAAALVATIILTVAAIGETHDHVHDGPETVVRTSDHSHEH
jgi:hypothetical protein